MGRLLCALGWHQWSKWRDMARGNEGARQRRECLRCGVGERRVVWTLLIEGDNVDIKALKDWRDQLLDSTVRTAILETEKQILAREMQGDGGEEPTGIL